MIGRPSAGGVTWVWARRDLDIATVATAKEELAVLLEPAPHPAVVLVYLGREYFVDLRGLRLLTMTAARVRSRGGDLAVVAPPVSLQQMVRLCHAEAALPLMADARQAARWARTRGSGAR